MWFDALPVETSKDGRGASCRLPGGDVVGYGENPREALQALMEAMQAARRLAAFRAEKAEQSLALAMAAWYKAGSVTFGLWVDQNDEYEEVSEIHHQCAGDVRRVARACGGDWTIWGPDGRSLEGWDGDHESACKAAETALREAYGQDITFKEGA